MRKIADETEKTAPVICEYFSNKDAISAELGKMAFVFSQGTPAIGSSSHRYNNLPAVSSRILFSFTFELHGSESPHV